MQVTNAVATELTLQSDTTTFQVSTSAQQNSIALLHTKDEIYFSIYPNPVKTTATVAFNLTGNCTIKLTDISGNTLQTNIVTAKSESAVKLDLSKYAAGVYFITINNEEKKRKL